MLVVAVHGSAPGTQPATNAGLRIWSAFCGTAEAPEQVREAGVGSRMRPSAEVKFRYLYRHALS